MMKPIDAFYYVKHNKFQYDSSSLMQLYFPIIGADAVNLYQYLIHFFDDGAQAHKFGDILNHLQFGSKRLEDALVMLTAIDLLVLYQLPDGYLIKLNPPLGNEAFLNNPIYSRLLEQKIGDLALSELQIVIPSQAKNISKKFSDVFGGISPKTKSVAKTKNQFDIDSFKNLMNRDGLQFEDDNQDVIDLYSISEQYGMTWFETYHLAKDTAVGGKIRPKRMLQQKNQANKPKETTVFSPPEQVILREAKSSNPALFLAKIKKARQASVTKDEENLLVSLAEMNLLDEVINIMVLYTFNKTKSANLKKSYILKIANDFSYQGVTTAEDAILKLRAFAERKESSTSKKTQVSNVPKWSNPDYQENTSQEEQVQLDQFKQAALRRLENLKKGGD